jgi:hypothetical protein
MPFYCAELTQREFSSALQLKIIFAPLTQSALGTLLISPESESLGEKFWVYGSSCFRTACIYIDSEM